MERRIQNSLRRGRPETDAGRLPKEIKTYNFLDELGISYECLDHEATDSMAACQGVDALLGVRICKNLFLCNRQKTKFYLLVMPGEKTFHTKDLSKQISTARLSFADAEFMEEYLCITPGSVSILGLMNDTEGNVQLLIDRDVLKEEFFGCHPCINTSSLKLTTADLLETVIPALQHTPIFVEL